MQVKTVNEREKKNVIDSIIHDLNVAKSIKVNLTNHQLKFSSCHQLQMIVIATTVIQANSLRVDSNVEPPTKASESAADAPNAEALTLVIHKHPAMSKLHPFKIIERRDDDDVVVIRSNRPKRRPQTRNRRPSQFRSKIKHLASGGSPSSFGGFKDYGGSKDYGSSPRFPPFPTKHYGEPPRASNKYKRGPKPSPPPSSKYKNKKSKKKPTSAYGPPTTGYGPPTSAYGSPSAYSPSSNIQQVEPPFAQTADTFNERPLQTLQQQQQNFPSYSFDTVHSSNNLHVGETAKVKQSFTKYHQELAEKYPNLNGNLPKDLENFHPQANFQNDADKFAPPLNNFPLEAGSSFNSQKTSYGYPVRNQGTPTLSFNPNIVTTHLNSNQKQKNQNYNQQNNHNFDQNLNPESEQFGNYESNVNHFVNHQEPEQHSEPNSYRGNQNSRPNNHEFDSNHQNFNSRPAQNQKLKQNQISNHNLNGVPSGSYNINFAPTQQNSNSNSNFPKLPSRYEQQDFSTPTRTNPNQNQYVNEFGNYNEVSETQSVQNRVPSRPNSVFNKFNNFDYDFGKNKGSRHPGPEEGDEESDENVDFVFSDTRNTRGRATTSTTTTTEATTTTRRPKYGKRKRPVKVSQNHNLDTDDLRDAFTESSDNQEISADFHEVALSSDDFVSPFDSQRKKKRKQNQFLHEIPSTLKTARTEQEALRQALGDDFELVSVQKSLDKTSVIDVDPFDFQRKSDDFVVSSDLRFGEVLSPDSSQRQPASFWNGDFNNFPRNHRFV